MAQAIRPPTGCPASKLFTGMIDNISEFINHLDAYFALPSSPQVDR
jgi:hypothetical protein